MFEKKVACEKMNVVAGGWAALSSIFHKSGKESLSEFELWKMAKDLGVSLPDNIRQYVEADKIGLYKLKKPGE